MPDVPLRSVAQIAAELRAARTLAGLSQRELSAVSGVNQTAVTRAETGKIVLDRGQVTAWLRAVKADPDVRDKVLKLTKAAHGEIRTWQDVLADGGHLQDEVRAKNATAVLVQNFQPTMLPALLSTADYIRLMVEFTDPDEQLNREASLAGKIAGQSVLREPGRRFEFIVAEHLLSWEPAPGVLTPQLAHLASVAELESVSLAVLPASYRGSLPEHNFVIREPEGGGPAYVSVELVHAEATIEKPDDVAVYRRTWDRLLDGALRGGDAIERIREEVRRRSS